MSRASEFPWIASVGLGRYVMAMGPRLPMQFTKDHNLAIRLSTLGRTQMTNGSPPTLKLTFLRIDA